jgi:hypothetical protein
MPPRIEFMVVLCGSGGLRAGNVGCENERVATANPQASRMLTATRLCGDQVGEYQARTDRGKHSSGSLEEASPPQPKTPGPSLYHILGNYSIIRAASSFLPKLEAISDTICHNGRKPRTTSRRTNSAHNNVPLRILLAQQPTPRSRNIVNHNLQPKLYFNHPPYLILIHA